MANLRGNEPAFPFEGGENNGEQPNQGMTLREDIAKHLMAGILANKFYDPPRRNKLDGMAEDAVNAADALLAALEKS